MRLAVLRHVEDLKRAGKRGFRFSPDHANEAINFIEGCCRHSSGQFAGEPFLLSDWQKFCLWSLFGWRREDGMRRFQRSLIEIARKNGKSTFAAALALLLLVFDNPVEAAAEVYCCATKEQQARIVHREAQRMVRHSPALKRRLRVLTKAINYHATDGFFQPLGSDSDTTDGLNTHAVIGDELHAWQEKHRGLFEKITTAGGARRQPLVCFITTAGEERSRIWQEERAYGVRCVESVLSGEIVDDSFFAFVACLDHKERPCPGCRRCRRKGRRKRGPSLNEQCDGSGTIPADDEFDETVWAKANPNLGVSVSADYLRTRANEARNKPTAHNTWLRYHCNVMVSALEKAIPPELWAHGSGPLSVEDGASGHAGIDLGRSDDWASVSCCFPFSGETRNRYELLSKSFTTEARAEELQTDQVRRWIEQGLLEVHWGDQIDYARIREWILELCGRFQIKTIAYDPTFAHQLGQELKNDHGLEVFPFTRVFEGYRNGSHTLYRS